MIFEFNPRRLRSSRLATLLLSGTLMLGVSACSDSDDPVSPNNAETTRVRAIHLSPDAPAVDIFLTSPAGAPSRAASGVAFPNTISYATVDAGTYTLDVSAAGSPASDAVLSVAGLNFEADKSYTAVAYNNLGSISALALEDDYSNLASGNIRVRAIHTAVGVGQVDIWNIPASGSPSPLYTDVDFGVAGQYLDLPAGAYTLGFDLDNDAVPDVIFELPSLPAGTVANVFAVTDSDSNVFLQAQLETGDAAKVEPQGDVAPAQLRAIHLSPDAPTVDVFLNQINNAAFSSVSFTDGSPFADVDAGTYRIDLAPAGSGVGSSVFNVDGLALESGTSYTAVVYNNLSSLSALPLVDDLESVNPGEIRVRAIHTAVGVGQVDIWNVPANGSPSPLYTDVNFGDAGGYLDLPVSAYTLGFDLDNDANPELYFDIPELASGTVANVFAVSDDSGVFLIAQLQDGATVRIDPATTKLRAIHLSPDAPSVDVYVNGDMSPAVRGLAFEEGTGYLDINAGTTTIDIAPGNTSIGDAVLSVDGLALSPGGQFTAVAFDELSSISALALADDESGLAAGNLRVRAIHTAVGVGEVDIWNVPEVGDPSPLYTDVPFGAVGNYLDLPAGAYTLGFDVDNDANPDLLFSLPALPAGTVANVFAVAQEGTVFLLAQLQDGTVARIDVATASLRAIHLSPDAPDVDVYVEGGRVFEELRFPNATAFADVPVGLVTLDIAPANTSVGDAVLTVPGLDLKAGGSYTAVAFDDVASLSALALADDFSEVPSGSARVRAIHAADGVGQVDIWNVPDSGDPTPLYTDVDFGVAGGYLEIPQGAYNLGFDVDNDAVPDLVFNLPTLQNGDVANIFALAKPGGTVVLLVQLADGTLTEVASH